ncbi:hypothetical protein KC19_12G077200 [Ceratodon purpureus]|uniref:Uncharacterized protein n=1 Tax=Ceratodon purpureus TaxID=3225 RepID=A0A8T0G5Y4_CERPU|nr:hypothetical protein KC19_12G077200 [Ceratodon purpureus]
MWLFVFRPPRMLTPHNFWCLGAFPHPQITRHQPTLYPRLARPRQTRMPKGAPDWLSCSSFRQHPKISLFLHNRLSVPSELTSHETSPVIIPEWRHKCHPLDTYGLHELNWVR